MTIQHVSSAGASAVGNVPDIASSPSSASDAVPALPDPVSSLALSGDPGAELAALMVKSGSEQRKVAQTARDTQENIQEHEDASEVDAMRQKAGTILSAGFAEGVGMMAQAGFGFAAANVDGPEGSTARADAVGLRAEGTFANAVCTIDAASAKAQGANLDADAASHKAAADRAHTAADDLHDAKKGGDDLVSAALDFYRDYVSAQATEHSAALHRS